MEYTDKQIEEAVNTIGPFIEEMDMVHYAKLLMRMMREEVKEMVARSVLIQNRLLDEAQEFSRKPAPEFWKTPVQEKHTGEWQPIETAPEDGTVIIGLLNGKYPEFIRFMDLPSLGIYEWGFAYRADRLAGEPTHWMPMPEPP